MSKGERSKSVPADHRTIVEKAGPTMHEDEKRIRSILIALSKDRGTVYSSHRAAAANQALVRLEQGSYGVCSDCGEKIHEARLKAVPEAAMCFECQSAREVAASPN